MKKVSYREHLLHQITNRIRQSLELPEILNTAVQEIQAFLKVDRVKVYRFDVDGSGEVIAESIEAEHLPSLLNLRFPAADVPPEARKMFIKARQRVIVDVATQRKTLQRLDCPDTGKNLPVRDIRYAAVDPCHVRYLTTMGVMASLVIPILHQRHLWGLLAVHHATPRHFTERELEIIQLLVDQLSIAIAQSNLLSQARQQAEYEATLNRVSHLLHCPMRSVEIRQGVLEAAVEALDGSGGRLYIIAEPTGEPAQLYTVGEQPLHSSIENSLAWQELTGCHFSMGHSNSRAMAQRWQDYKQSLSDRVLYDPNKVEQVCSIPRAYTLAELHQNPTFAPLVSEFDHTKIRSILMIPLQFHQQYVGYLTIFRDCYDVEILWAGRQDEDTRNQLPRSSFALWRELKADQAPEWSADEVKLAQSIGLHVYMAIVQKRVESMIRYQASHDGLTNLPNRLLFNEQLSLALIQAHQQDEMLGVAFLDLDRFKTINDSLGHAVGDQLLQQVADSLRLCLRDCDVIARWGGDEFTLLLPHLNSAEDITQIAQRILDKLSLPFYAEQELYVTASLGISLYPYDGEDVETLLKNADVAMYQAKQMGKNNYQLYVEEMNTKVVRQLSLEGDLRRAIANQELALHYQPQIDIQTGKIVGVEALLRWQHPQLGFISPAEFIPLAEESGLICTIGNWVLQTACKQQQLWYSAGLFPVRVAINLSAQQFQQTDLVNTMIQVLETTQVRPEYLEIEITESAAMRDVNFTISILRQLQDIGVTIAIDDFGTGYSSLNAIKYFPLHILKIDRSFVHDAVQDPSDAAIAKTIVALGKGLGLNVLAEGVETQEQLDFLRSIQCDSAQGYFFSKPLPPEEIAKLLMRSRI